MSDLQLFQNAGVPANLDDIKSRLIQAQQQAPASNSGAQYLKMNQVGSPAAGELTYGAEQTPVEEGSLWALNWRGLQHGFILRDGGAVNGEAWVSVFQPLPGRDTLQPPRGREEWKQAYKAQLVCISGEDVGTTVEYSGDAGGVIKFFRDVIIPGITAQLDRDPDALYPVVTFDVTSYYSDKQKKDIYEARGSIAHWMDDEGLQAALTGDKVSSVATEKMPGVSSPPTHPTPAQDADATPAARGGRQRRQRRAN